MLNENAKKWVAALRSGKYQQGKTMLCENGKHCCLGVACEIAIANGIALEREVKEDGHVSYGDGFTAIMPLEVTQWLKLSNNLGSNKTGESLAVKNDKGVPFDQIADFIESEPKGLFVESA